jgi:hypothetical protein
VTNRLSRVSSMTTKDVERVESSPSPAPCDYHSLLQLLSNYIRLFEAVVRARSRHKKEVVAIQATLRRRMDLFIGIGPKEILYLVWAIFLDASEFFAHQIEDTDDLPESQLHYTTNFLGEGRIPTNLLGVPLSQFMVASQPPPGGSGGGYKQGTDMFRDASVCRRAEVSPERDKRPHKQMGGVPENMTQKVDSVHPTEWTQGKQDKRRSLLQPQERAAGHPFLEILHQWTTKGVPVNCGPEWQWSTIKTAVAWEAHCSALEPENVQLVHKDIKYQVEASKNVADSL